MNLFNISAMASALVALFAGAGSAVEMCASSGNGTGGVDGTCSSHIMGQLVISSDMEMQVSIYEQLQNKTMQKLVNKLAPGAVETVSLLEPETSSLVVTVPGVSEIVFNTLELSSDLHELTLPPRRPPVQRNDEVRLLVDLPTGEVSLRDDGSSRAPLIHTNGPRAVSSTHPQAQYLKGETSTCMAAKFRSLSVKPVYQFYDPKNGRDGVLSATLRLGQETTTNTYEGHEFYFTTELPKKLGGGRSTRPKEVARFVMVPDQVTYLIVNEGDDVGQIPGHLAHKYRETAAHNSRELAFLRKYKEATGLEYKHFYGSNGPRAPPQLFMHRADRVGQVHRVLSPERHWRCVGSAAECQGGSEMPRLNLTLEVVSTAPRAFHISNFFSDFEADHLIQQSRRHIRQSGVGDGQTGQHDSDTRTSKNTWLKRDRDDITNSLYLRAADLLQLDENILHTSSNIKLPPDQKKSAVEDIQVVNYQVGQEYQTHHDWGVSGYPESRYITLLLYLNNPLHEHAGGETSFPKSSSNSHFQIVPKKGSAVLFYNLLEDGNGDDLSAHAAKSVEAGEKWLANFWVWDPSKKN